MVTFAEWKELDLTVNNILVDEDKVNSFATMKVRREDMLCQGNIYSCFSSEMPRSRQGSIFERGKLSMSRTVAWEFAFVQRRIRAGRERDWLDGSVSHRRSSGERDRWHRRECGMDQERCRADQRIRRSRRLARREWIDWVCHCWSTVLCRESSTTLTPTRNNTHRVTSRVDRSIRRTSPVVVRRATRRAGFSSRDPDDRVDGQERESRDNSRSVQHGTPLQEYNRNLRRSSNNAWRSPSLDPSRSHRVHRSKPNTQWHRTRIAYPLRPIDLRWNFRRPAARPECTNEDLTCRSDRLDRVERVIEPPRECRADGHRVEDTANNLPMPCRDISQWNQECVRDRRTTTNEEDPNTYTASRCHSCGDNPSIRIRRCCANARNPWGMRNVSRREVLSVVWSRRSSRRVEVFPSKTEDEERPSLSRRSDTSGEETWADRREQRDTTTLWEPSKTRRIQRTARREKQTDSSRKTKRSRRISISIRPANNTFSWMKVCNWRRWHS